MIGYIKRLILKILFLCMRIFEIKKNKIVITSYYGKGYGDSAKYICKELIRRNNNYDIIWLVNDLNEDFPSYIRKVKYKSIKGFYALATAGIWIDNSRKHDYILKRKNQYYIQTWHSSLRLKKIEGDAIEDLPRDYIRNAKSDSKKIDLLTVGCKFSEETFDRCFWYYGCKLRCGTPRCDIFFQKDEIAKIKMKIKKKYHIKNETKIILYAPTFKKNSRDNEIDYNMLINNLNLNGKYVLFVRFHPISKSTVKSSDKIINMTNYPDIQELISICDFMITDYSGCCFDAMIANKPCILFTPDFEKYIKTERKLTFDFNEIPFKRTYNINELVNEILKFDYKKYKQKIELFNKKIGSYEKGTASSQIVDIIDERIKNYEKI